MTRDEFKAWWINYAAVFPETAAWIRGLEDGKAVLEGWAKALADTDHVAAGDVTHRMIAGDIEAVKPYERELTAAKVRAAAAIERVKRQAKSMPAAADPIPEGRPRPFPFGSLFRGLAELREKGSTEAQQAAWIAAQLPATSHPDGPRFHCPLCCDSGQVEIAHVALVQAYQRGGIDEATRSIYRVMTVRCSCARGSRGNSNNSESRYRPAIHCRVYGGDTESAPWWERFERWYAEAAEESESTRDTRNEWQPA